MHATNAVAKKIRKHENNHNREDFIGVSSDVWRRRIYCKQER